MQSYWTQNRPHLLQRNHDAMAPRELRQLYRQLNNLANFVADSFLL